MARRTPPGLTKIGQVWYIRYEGPRHPDGRRNSRKECCRGMTREQAEQRLREIKSELHNGVFVGPSVKTVAQHLEEWLERRRPDLSPTTAQGYQAYIKNRISPALGGIRLDKLSPLAIQQFLDGLLKEGLKAKTVRSVHGVLHAALAQAVRLQMLARNPADQVQVPRLVRPEIKTVPPESMPALLAAIDQSCHRVPLLTILATGLRRGEVLGLKWQDLDANARTLAVRRSICRVGGRNIVKSTKTGKSRVIKIPAVLVEELQRHRKAQESLSALKPSFKPEGWMFPDTRTGETLNPQALGSAFDRIAGELGIGVTLHGLRHTQATTLMAAGVPVKVVSERLGHSTTAITLDTYSHVLPHLQDSAADVMEDVLRPHMEKRVSLEG